jgi:hypothetical protein
METKLIAIARIIVCPRWEHLIEALREDRTHPRMLWERQCRECGAIMAVPQDVMEEVEKEPSIRLLCDECVPLHDRYDDHAEHPPSQ